MEFRLVKIKLAHFIKRKKLKSQEQKALESPNHPNMPEIILVKAKKQEDLKE